MYRSIARCALAALLCACAAPNASVKQGVGQSPDKPVPRTILLLPPDVKVHEMSAGGVVEKVDAWSKAASENASQYVRVRGATKAHYEVVEGPALAPEERATLEQHVALYELVAGTAYLAQNSQFPVWRERAKNFDYTLGPGLKPLSERAGVDAAMIVIGTDYISSSGRKFAQVMGAVVAIGLALGGVYTGQLGPPGGVAFMSVGVVDMRTGDLIWFGTDRSKTVDLRDEADVRSMLDRLFDTYPGAMRTTGAADAK